MRSTAYSSSGGGGLALFGAIALAIGVNVAGYMAWRSSAASAPPPPKRPAVVASSVPRPSPSARATVAHAAAPPPVQRPAAPPPPRVIAVEPPTVSQRTNAKIQTSRPAVSAPRTVRTPSAPNTLSNPQPASQSAGQTVKTSIPIVSYPEWNNAAKLNIAEPTTTVKQQVAAVQDWAQAANLLSINPQELFSRPLVEPYCRGQRNPDLSEFGSLSGKQGRVTVHCTLSADGRPSVQISPSGDAVLDRVAYKLGNDTMWLPALRYGKPVEYTFDYVMVFAACDYH